LALLVVPTPGGIYLSVTAIFAFLLRHPLKLFLKHREQWTRSTRGRVALRVVLLYGGAAFLGLVSTIRVSGIGPVLPVLVASPFIVVYLFYDSKNQTRALLSELAGPLGLAAVAPAIALVGDWSWPRASVLWIILVARTIPSISYVRARLRLERGRPFARTPVLLLHLAFIIALSTLAWFDRIPFLAVVALLILIGRAILGLSRYRRFKRARQIGFMEIGYGLIYVLVTAVGYWLDG